MAKKKRRSKMLSPMIDVIGIGITSQAVGSVGATGSTAHVLNAIPTVMAAKSLKKHSKKWW